MADADKGRNDDALIGATRLGGLQHVGDYLSKSAEALGRIPNDVLRYWSSLPINNEYEPLGVRAVQGTNYAIDSGLQALSGGRWGLAPLLAGVGLPTKGLEQGIQDFGRRNAAPLQIARDLGEASMAGLGPTGSMNAMAQAPSAVARSVEPGGTIDRAATAFERAAKEAGDPSKSNIFIGYVGAGNLAKAGRPAAQEALAMAERLKADGKTPEEIWKATSDYVAKNDPDLAGVHFGADGKPRVEINDASAGPYSIPSAPLSDRSLFSIGGDIYEAKGTAKEYLEGILPSGIGPDSVVGDILFRLEAARGNIVKLGRQSELGSGGLYSNASPTPSLKSYMRYPSFEQAYPEAIRGGVQRYADQYRGGKYEPSGDAIVLNSGIPADAQRSTLFHEMQHGVQEYEGLGKGADPKSFIIPEKTMTRILMGIGELPAEGSSFSQQLVNSAKLTFPEFKGSSLKDVQIFVRSGQLSGKLPVNTDIISTALARNLANDMYMRSSGEVESRNVQKRLHMDAGERRDTPPWKTQDVPYESQLVRK